MLLSGSTVRQERRPGWRAAAEHFTMAAIATDRTVAARAGGLKKEQGSAPEANNCTETGSMRV
jgi:hypothetical protein